MNILMNYANCRFTESQKLNSKTGKKVGLFDDVISYSPKDIDRGFYEGNKNILDKERGGGYWLWKPYFIKKTLEMMHWDDFLFYCDSGSYFIRPVTPLIDISLSTRQEIIVFEIPCIEREWTKRDAFILMDCDSQKYTDTRQRMSGFSLWKKSKYTMDFIDEYLSYAQDERIITDISNQCGHQNYPGFEENRHDQSILSLLSKKHGLVAYRDPSQWGNRDELFYPNSTYEQLIKLTRKKNFSHRMKRKFLHKMKSKFPSLANYILHQMRPNGNSPPK